MGENYFKTHFSLCTITSFSINSDTLVLSLHWQGTLTGRSPALKLASSPGLMLSEFGDLLFPLSPGIAVPIPDELIKSVLAQVGDHGTCGGFERGRGLPCSGNDTSFGGIGGEGCYVLGVMEPAGTAGGDERTCDCIEP